MSTQREPIIYEAKYNNAVVTGLTVTFDLYRSIDGGKPNKIKTGESMTEIGDGLYYYALDDFETFYSYIAIFDAGTNNVDGGRYRFGHYGSQRGQIESMKQVIGTIPSGQTIKQETTPQQIKYIIDELKKGLKFDAQGEEIKKLIQSTAKLLKTPQSQDNSQITKLLKELIEKYDEIEDKLEDFYSLPEILSKKTEELKFDPSILIELKGEILENIPERIIENKTEYNALKVELSKIKEFIEKGEYSNLEKLRKIYKYINDII